MVLLPFRSDWEVGLQNNMFEEKKMTRLAPKMGLAKQIHQMVRVIVRQFHPDKIILFGSHARGEAGPDSDIDLLVVMPIRGSIRDKRIEIGAALSKFGIPID